MPKQTLIYRDIFPLIPDAAWLSSRELHDLLVPHRPEIKLENLRVSLNLWEKRGLIISKAKEVEAVLQGSRYLYIHHPKKYRKAVSIHHGHMLVNQTPNVKKRKCLGCGHPFWPENKYNFMCPPCGSMFHD